MAVDQYGHYHHNLGKHPRKELMKRIGRSHASKMYVDRKDGSAVCIGYIIGGLWLHVLAVSDWKIKVRQERL